MSHPWLAYGHRGHADPQPNAPALELQGLCVGYPGAPRPVLAGLDWVVPPGARMALVGANGAGKSTLLKAVAGLLPVTGGAVRIYGNPIGACHHRVAYLPQRGEVDWRFPLDVRRLVLTGRYVHLGWCRRPRGSDRALVDAVLERLGLAGLAQRQIGELSGGEQQRVLLARALVQEGELLLLDEPFNAVDAGTRQLLAEIEDELQAAGKTLIVATHDLDGDRFDGVLYLQDGRVAGCGVAA